MKKILFISTRNPYSGRYSGDVIRSFKIINILKKKYKIDLVYLGKKTNINNLGVNLISFDQPNILKKIFYCFISIMKFEPMQFGLFFSKSMKDYIEENSNNYDLIFFHHIRSYPYLPKNYYGKTILDMGDLYSENYLQTFKYLNVLNPLKYIYYFESLFVKKIEEKIFSSFDKVLLFSKKEIQSINKKFFNNLFHIDESVEKINKSVKYSINNSYVLFVGNLNYLPNILAVKDFIKKILPTLVKKIPNIKFCIIGDIKKIDKFFLSKNKDVIIPGPQKNIAKYVKNSFCGIANLSIATGVQVKVLTYMSFGLPVICSKQVAINFDKSTIVYKSDEDLINKIIEIKKKKAHWNKFSKKSISFIKKFKWKNISSRYFKLINL